jgi:hypothetical protein
MTHTATPHDDDRAERAAHEAALRAAWRTGDMAAVRVLLAREAVRQRRPSLAIKLLRDAG